MTFFFPSVRSSSISSFQTVLQHSEQNYIDKVRIHLLEENTVLLLSANITFMCSYLNNSPGQPNESTESKQYSVRFYYDWSDCNLRKIVPISVTTSKPEVQKQLLHVWDRITLHYCQYRSKCIFHVNSSQGSSIKDILCKILVNNFVSEFWNEVPRTCHYFFLSKLRASGWKLSLWIEGAASYMALSTSGKNDRFALLLFFLSEVRQ